MIDFRYHLVSIVAVFLALAIGIVLGSTELQGNTIDVLRTSQNSLKNQLDQSNAERGVAQQQVQTYQTFVDKTESKLLADGLTGDRIVLVTEPGASSQVISGVTHAATLEKWAAVDDRVPVDVAVLLQDAQTSGGLLLASADPEGLTAELGRRGVLAAVVGRVSAGEAGHIDVRV